MSMTKGKVEVSTYRLRSYEQGRGLRARSERPERNQGGRRSGGRVGCRRCKMTASMDLRVTGRANSRRYGISESFFCDFCQWFFPCFLPDFSGFGRMGKRRNDRFRTLYEYVTPT